MLTGGNQDGCPGPGEMSSEVERGQGLARIGVGQPVASARDVSSTPAVLGSLSQKPVAGQVPVDHLKLPAEVRRAPAPQCANGSAQGRADEEEIPRVRAAH
jgi:hypothetical protein